MKSSDIHLEALIIGAGISGLCVAARLERAGMRSFLVLEKAGDVGGTWRDNNYPGCACDIPSHLYSLSFEPNPAWSQMFAPQGEILAYLRNMAARRGLMSRIRFCTTVQSATWDEAAAMWRVRTTQGRNYTTRVLVSALGALHHPAIPRLPGLEQFRGERFHSATWNHGYELAGKRVAVIGTGASSIQFVPRIVDQVARLHLFQRTPPWILPKANPVFGPEMQWRFRWLPLYRLGFRSRLFWVHEQRVHGFTDKPERMDKIEGFARALLERQVADPALRARLTPDYAIGCKRLLISSDYYPALQKPNAELVTEGIREVRAGSIVTTDGVERGVDALIFGTGFDTQNNLSRLDVRGRGGRTLGQTWSERTEAYAGTMISGFPNLFVMLGPNSGLTHNSQIFMIESQTRLILSALKAMRQRGERAIDVSKEAQADYNQELQGRLAHSVWQAGGCSNWYHDAAGNNTINWPGTSLEYFRLTRQLRISHFSFGSPALASGKPSAAPVEPRLAPGEEGVT